MLNQELLKKIFGGRLPLAPTGEVSDDTPPFSATPSGGDTPQRPVTFCVTGQMAAGKNFISSILINTFPSIKCIDLDTTVHKAIELCRDQIIGLFGETVLNEDGTINRKKIAGKVFADPELLKKHESILYPKVIQLTEEFISKAHSKNYSVILNATVLYKTPQLMNQCDFIMFVTAPESTRLKRAQKRDGLSKEEILSRFHNQADLYEQYQKTGKPIFTIENP